MHKAKLSATQRFSHNFREILFSHRGFVDINNYKSSQLLLIDRNVSSLSLFVMMHFYLIGFLLFLRVHSLTMHVHTIFWGRYYVSTDVLNTFVVVSPQLLSANFLSKFPLIFTFCVNFQYAFCMLAYTTGVLFIANFYNSHFYPKLCIS